MEGEKLELFIEIWFYKGDPIIRGYNNFKAKEKETYVTSSG